MRSDGHRLLEHIPFVEPGFLLDGTPLRPPKGQHSFLNPFPLRHVEIRDFVRFPLSFGIACRTTGISSASPATVMVSSSSQSTALIVFCLLRMLEMRQGDISIGILWLIDEPCF